MLNAIGRIAVQNKWILYKIQDTFASHKFYIVNILELNVSISITST
jgi:hypothetical protein